MDDNFFHLKLNNFLNYYYKNIIQYQSINIFYLIMFIHVKLLLFDLFNLFIY